MTNVLGYDGKAVVITGAASGMGAAAARMLVDLGAEVHALDIGDVTAPVRQSIKVDMKDKAAIEAAIAKLPNQIDVLFNCAGVPHPPVPALDTIMINFVGLRHLTDQLLPRLSSGGVIASIASTAGMAYKKNLETVRTCLALKTFDAAAAWLKTEPELKADPYGFSKQCIIVYTQTLASDLAKRGIRINCISPSPTQSDFMSKLTTVVPEEAISPFFPPNGRFAESEEMGRALVMMGSDLACFVSGVNLPVDFGYCAEVAMEQRENLMGIS
ncbi:MAG: coniferyl-alcohol dehydrogenase [Myxococcota bacterium]|jgi:NAD(P)-dependent dehydrogenase (short-subunit alcohol dehydrogenase family)|nr:coniferyl-alcohol dehydrogenase [Myxococcota bacterium]